MRYAQVNVNPPPVHPRKTPGWEIAGHFRKEEKPLLSKQTLGSSFSCLACQHFCNTGYSTFLSKKSLGGERPLSLA